MRTPRTLGMWMVLLSLLALAGCTAPATSTPTPNAPTQGDTPAPVVAVALEVSLDGIQVVNGDGSRGESALFTDGAATLALLTKELGTAQTDEKGNGNGNGNTAGSYEWDGLSLRVATEGSARAVITGPRAVGLSLRTTEGIEVGSTEAEVESAASPGTQLESNGDTYFGLQAKSHPGTQSLTFPGRVGLDYIDVTVTGGVVSVIISPGGDWQDI